MMNWYKKAKIIDLSFDPSKLMYVYCPMCNKWKTIDKTGKIIWKPFYEMSQEEQTEINDSQQKFQEGKSVLKQTICPDCKNEY